MVSVCVGLSLMHWVWSPMSPKFYFSLESANGAGEGDVFSAIHDLNLDTEAKGSRVFRILMTPGQY